MPGFLIRPRQIGWLELLGVIGSLLRNIDSLLGNICSLLASIRSLLKDIHSLLRSIRNLRGLIGWRPYLEATPCQYVKFHIADPLFLTRSPLNILKRFVSRRFSCRAFQSLGMSVVVSP